MNMECLDAVSSDGRRVLEAAIGDEDVFGWILRARERGVELLWLHTNRDLAVHGLNASRDTSHDLRHRRISLEHLRGQPWACIGELVGQRNLAVTANTYTHVLVDETEIDYAAIVG